MRRLVYVTVFLVMASCVSVPKAAPELSQQLGVQLRQLEAAHLSLIHRFFDGERQNIHRFIDAEWLPLFADNFFEQPTIAAAWQKTVDADKSMARLTFIKRVYPEIQYQTSEKYKELSQPLNQLEQKLVQAVQQKYGVAKTINRNLTAYLSSAAKSSDYRWKYLREVGVEQAEVDAVIDEVTTFSGQALQRAEKLQTLEAQIEAYKAQLEHLLSNL